MALLLVAACAQQTAPMPTATQPGETAPRVIFPDKFAVTVEVAANDETREQGLMYRDQLAQDRGMIFLFPKSGDYPFWMKNTLIPLDMVWIDASRKIVHVGANIQPCKADPCPSYDPKADAMYVLEVAAGVATKHALKNGDVLRFEGLDKVVAH